MWLIVNDQRSEVMVKRHRIRPLLLVPFLLVSSLTCGRWVGCCEASSSAATASSCSSPSASASLARSTLPRSTSSSSTSGGRGNPKRRLFPPWNASPQIDPDGFLKQLYARVPGEWEPEVRLRTSHTIDQRAKIRQVPGDGNCLFHSISFCLRHAINGTHWSVDDLDELYQFSHELRLRAVQHLSSSRRLFLQGRESLRARELVQAAAQQYQLTADEYCACMLQDSVWAGGPELVSLCNLLQRPIHVYELAVASSSSSTSGGGGTTSPASAVGSSSSSGDECFVLRRMACFGSPKFDHKHPLHILSADSRFPDIQPGHQLGAGNHFLAVFPQRDPPPLHNRHKNRKLRGGGRGGRGNNDDFDTDYMDGNGLDTTELDDQDDAAAVVAAAALPSSSSSLTGLVSHWIQSWLLWWKQSFL